MRGTILLIGVMDADLTCLRGHWGCISGQNNLELTGQVLTALPVILLPLAYIALQWLALRRMQAGWQTAALLPVGVMALALLVMVFGLAAGTDLAVASVFVGLPVATLYLLILLPLHSALRRS